MVCHVLPAPLPETDPIHVALRLSRLYHNIFTSFVYELGETKFEEFITSRGFSSHSLAVYFNTSLASNFATASGRSRNMVITRTVEEGWLLFDVEKPRWKRLGWLDTDVPIVGDANDDANIDIVVERLKATLLMNWVVGDAGWRYDVPEDMIDCAEWDGIPFWDRASGIWV